MLHIKLINTLILLTHRYNTFFHHNAFASHKFQSQTIFAILQDGTPHNPPDRYKKLALLKWEKDNTNILPFNKKETGIRDEHTTKN